MGFIFTTTQLLMAQPNKFQFILNIRGVDTEVLSNAPEGWLNTAIKYTRSKVYNGLFRGETLPAKYVTKAAMLLRTEFYNNGVAAFVKNTINLLNPYTWAYNSIYQGRLDFSTTVDDLTSFSVNSISDDFSVQLTANDAIDYAIPMDVDEAINLELTPLNLAEAADIILLGNTDHRANAFFQLEIVNNQQNSVNPSVYNYAGQFAQVNTPNYSTDQHYMFFARTSCNVLFTVAMQGICFYNGGSGPAIYTINVVKSDGTIVKNLFTSTGTTVNVNINATFSIPVLNGDRLFLYFGTTDGDSNWGFRISSGTINMKYQTISPATMCKALPAAYVFKKLLEAMNTNTDSAPNQPVPYKSNLLNGPLGNLLITCSDSIRLATGSLFHQTDTLFPGTYKVFSGSIIYGGTHFTLNQIFPYQPSVLSFTGTGIVQKVLSGFVGVVYNPGDTLQAGGTYLVGGNTGTFVTYNAISYSPGQFFTYYLGVSTFTGSDDSNFVEQTGVAPQMIISFKSFWQSIYSVMGGNCAFGIEQVPNPDPVKAATQPKIAQCFIEDLSYVFRATIGNLDVGVVDTAIKFMPAVDLIPNSIKVGYNDPQLSTLNGFAEVNSNQTYTTVLLNPKKELNLISEINAAPYVIEEIRISQNDTAASRSSNDNHFVWKNTNPENTVPFTYYHPMRTEGLMTNPTTGLPMITGVDPSYYNWILSPKQNLLRGGPFLASVFYNMKGYKLILSAAPKNTALVTTDTNGRRVTEEDPVNVSDLPAPLFLPYYATFKPGLPTNALSMLDNIPYGYLKFTYNGTQYKGFADTISVDVGENSEQELKVLLTPGNDITTLIH